MAAVLRDIVASPLAERYRLDVIPTYRTPSPVARIAIFLGSLGALVRWCLGRGPRVVHVHTAMRGSIYRKGICVAVARALRRPVILHVHAGAGDITAFSASIGPLRRAFVACTFALADRVISVSTAGAQEICRRFGVEGITVVPNAAPRVSSSPRSPLVRADRLRMLYVGGFTNPVKGGTILVEAVPAIMASCPTAELDLAGPGEPPPSVRRMLDGSPRLHWLGWLEDRAKERALRATDIFLLPSISEGLPVALLEAMAYGLTIVATRAGGIPEVLTDDVDALLVPPGDAAALAEAAISLTDNPERRARLGLAAQRRAAALTAEDVCARLDALYREVLSTR
jgi:glycosyltransferase involved in cell wall biosynthesis